MDYHFKPFDIRNPMKWVYRKNGRQELFRKRVGDLKEVLRRRVIGDSHFMNEVVEVRRKVIRFDHDESVGVFYVRLSRVRFAANISLSYSTVRVGSITGDRIALERWAS